MSLSKVKHYNSEVEEMTNGEKFRKIFKEFATEVWAFTEKDFLTWLNAEYKEPTTKNDCEHCSKTYGTLGCCDFVSNEPIYSCKEGHEEYARGISKLGATTQNDLGVEEVTALAEWIEKLTKASEDAYNKGYADGVKSVNICPHCGEYIGEEE